MNNMQGRGYLVEATAQFLKDKIGEQAWNEVRRQASPELQRQLDRGFEPAGWYPVSMFNELIEQLVVRVGQNDEEKVKTTLFQCGQFAATSASNSFLKILLKIMTPTLFVRKAPTMFRRDFTMGRMDVEMNDNSLSARLYEMAELPHVAAYSPGFLAFPLNAMGKNVTDVKLTEWGLDKPYVEGGGFTIEWAA